MLTGRCLCGEATWRFEAMPERATICNCNACRRYGAIWIYGVLGETVFIGGATKGYIRHDTDGALAFHICASCGCPHSWQLTNPPSEGDVRLAVNLRLAEPEAVAAIPLHRFDGLETWSSKPDDDGRCVGDIWA